MARQDTHGEILHIKFNSVFRITTEVINGIPDKNDIDQESGGVDSEVRQAFGTLTAEHQANENVVFSTTNHTGHANAYIFLEPSLTSLISDIGHIGNVGLGATDNAVARFISTVYEMKVCGLAMGVAILNASKGIFIEIIKKRGIVLEFGKMKAHVNSREELDFAIQKLLQLQEAEQSLKTPTRPQQTRRKLDISSGIRKLPAPESNHKQSASKAIPGATAKPATRRKTPSPNKLG